MLKIIGSIFLLVGVVCICGVLIAETILWIAEEVCGFLVHRKDNSKR